MCDKENGLIVEKGNSIFSFSGMSKLKFKPAYNPYTEPSMEIFRL